MAKQDILLRQLTNAPLLTKGSELSWAELDGNFIEVYNSLVLLSQSSNVDPYSSAITYSPGSYSMENGQLWKMISGSSQINITPGAAGTELIWSPVFGSDLVTDPNKQVFHLTITQDLISGDNIVLHNMDKEIISFDVRNGLDFVSTGGSIIDSNNFNIDLSGGEILGAKIILMYKI